MISQVPKSGVYFNPRKGPQKHTVFCGYILQKKYIKAITKKKQNHTPL